MKQNIATDREQSAMNNLDIAYRAKHYNLVILSQENVESLFGEEIFNTTEK